MEEVIPGLYASPPETLPFAPSLEVRAFLLRRDPGNLLIYGAGTLTADAREIEGVGGVSRRYLNHRHEAAFAGDQDAWTFGAPLLCHENERRSVSERLEVSGIFSERHVVGGDFEVIPIPGHTRGATAYLWDTEEHRCFFTGDTVYLRRREWVAAVLLVERPRSIRREPRAHPWAGLRRARPLGGVGGRALLRLHRRSRQPAAHRRDTGTGAERGRRIGGNLPRTKDGGGPRGDSLLGQDTRPLEPSGQSRDVRHATCVIAGGGQPVHLYCGRGGYLSAEERVDVAPAGCSATGHRKMVSRSSRLPSRTNRGALAGRHPAIGRNLHPKLHPKVEGKGAVMTYNYTITETATKEGWRTYE